MSNRIKNNLKNLVGQTLNQYYSKVKPTISDLRYKQEYQNRIIECMVGEVDDNYIETPETDAPIVKLEHSKEGVVKIPSIKGKTILVDADGNETDTPAEGCRLVSVGESEDNKLIILSKNKNLINVEDFVFNSGAKCKLVSRNMDNGEISVTYNGIYAGFSIPLTNKINEMNGKTFRASYSEVINSNSNGRLSVQLTGTLKNGNSFYLYPSTNPVTITDEMKTLNFTILPNNTATSLEGSFTIKKLQLEQGTVATTFEKPKHHKTEILLDEPLRSLPNGVCDEIIDNKLIRRIGKVVLDGKNVTSIGIINDNIVDVLYFDKTVTNKKFINYGSEGQQLIKSNIYRTGINANNWNSTTSENTLVNTSLNGFWIFLPKFTVLNIEDARNYMNNKPTEVLYELSEPIIEELPNGITLQGYDDTTVYIENSITPTIQYGYNALISYKEELLNQQEEVKVNTLDIENNIIPYLMDMEFNLIMMEDNE